eukprot:1161732-Pelagomonas_calceolata.AAC.3
MEGSACLLLCFELSKICMLMMGCFEEWCKNCTCASYARLNVYARRQHLIFNTVKSEVVHFNSLGNHLPAFTIGSDTLAYKD